MVGAHIGMALRQEAEHGVHVARSAALGARRVAGLLRVAVHDAPACAQLHDQVDAAIILIHLLVTRQEPGQPPLRGPDGGAKQGQYCECGPASSPRPGWPPAATWLPPPSAA